MKWKIASLLLLVCLLASLTFNFIREDEVHYYNDTVLITEVDTVYFEREVKKPIPKEVIRTVSDTVIDSSLCNKIFIDYSSIRIYERNIPIDSLGAITITDSVQYNELQGYKYTGYFKDIRETITVNKYQSVSDNNKLFIGLLMTSGKE